MSAMRNEMNIRQQKKYKNNSTPKKTRFAMQKNTTSIKNNHSRDTNAIQDVRNKSPKAIPKSISKSKTVNQTSNVAYQIPSAELDYYNVRIFVLKYFLDHNRDLNNEVTLQILDKTIHKILKHLNEEQS